MGRLPPAREKPRADTSKKAGRSVKILVSDITKVI